LGGRITLAFFAAKVYWFRTMKKLFLLLPALLAAVSLHAKVVGSVVEYKDGDTTLEGYLAMDADFHGARPAVLIVHQWLGLTDYEKHRAEQLAAMGYVAFCADIYGKDVRPKDTKEAGAEATKYKSDRKLLRARVNAALEKLKSLEATDTHRVAAIGYCFGGTTVLELARSSADLAGVVSFHGGLDSPTPDDGQRIRCKVLCCHGADDPYVKADDLAAFEKEMREANVDWRLIKYGGAVHSFTQPMAGNDNSKGAAYNERADKRSWQDMKNFLEEIFKPNGVK
jgi:dienelactone hydrolase